MFKIYGILYVEAGSRIRVGPLTMLKDNKLYLNYSGTHYPHYFIFIEGHDEINKEEYDIIENDKFDELNSTTMKLLKQKYLDAVLKEHLIFPYGCMSDEFERDFNVNVNKIEDNRIEEYNKKFDELKKKTEVEFVSEGKFWKNHWYIP